MQEIIIQVDGVTSSKCCGRNMFDILEDCKKLNE